jgi:hypothetical protein
MEIEIDDYISEDEKKEIAISVFTTAVEKAFGGSEYDTSGKERDRVIKNAVSKWIETHIESILTDEDKQLIKDTVQKTIKKEDYSFHVFSKPDVWDRTEYSAYVAIREAVKSNQKFIENKVTESIAEMLTDRNKSE